MQTTSSLPPHWVDELFGRLSLRYGAAFMRQWSDMDMAAVKADWGQVLGSEAPDAIGWALRNLEPKPPTALDFRRLCRSAPKVVPVAAGALPLPRYPMPDHIRQQIRALTGRSEASA